MGDPGTLVAIGSALVAALGSWLVAVRRFSGKIKSSDAEELWAESRSIRAEYRTRIATLERENRELREGRATDRERIAVLESRIRQLEGTDEPGWLA